jgi:hypothetical protein
MGEDITQGPELRIVVYLDIGADWVHECTHKGCSFADRLRAVVNAEGSRSVHDTIWE